MKIMGEKARATYESLYSAKRNYQQLIEIYREAIESKSMERAAAH